MEMVWFAFRTKPQKEFVAQRILQKQGFRSFVPVETKLCRRNRYAKTKEARSFPMVIGYVFVEVPMRVPWFELFSLRILTSVVGSGGKPTPIPADAIGRLMQISGSDVQHVRSINTRSSFSVGDVVAIESGPLQGFTGRVEEVVGSKARMIFEMLGAKREIHVRIEDLVAA